MAHAANNDLMVIMADGALLTSWKSSWVGTADKVWIVFPAKTTLAL